MRPASGSIVLGMLLGAAPHVHAETYDLCDFEGGPSGPHSIAGYRATYDTSAVPQLIGKLEAETEEGRRACWAAVLGAVGDERAVGALIAAIERPLNKQYHEGRLMAIRALGLLVNRTGSARALAYLTDGLTLGAWRKRNVQGLTPFFPSYPEYDRLLSEYSLMALAESGDPRAGETLRSMQTSPKPGQALVGKELDDLLATWLEVHRLVAERGLQGMYDYYEEQRR